ncbi:hypothetical protein BGH96_05600 [Snodgrassella alvi]|nr:hypothetical protein BGH96_05600 [Snodgrassella alvi]
MHILFALIEIKSAFFRYQLLITMIRQCCAANNRKTAIRLVSDLYYYAIGINTNLHYNLLHIS